MNFTYCNTTKVYFTNDVKDVFDFVCSSGFKRILFVTGGESTKTIALRLKEEFDAALVKCFVVDGITTNPLSETIEEMAKVAKTFAPDVILTVGGGSVHDAGKAISIMMFSEGNTVEDYTVNGKLSVPGIVKTIPVITVPTVWGSGAEVSPAALVRIGNEKRVIFSPLLHPMATFVNTKFADSLTCYQISRSSFDSFVQALEGFISTLSNNISNAFARVAIENYNACLPALLNNQITNDVLEKLAISSIFSSYVCSTASVGAIHALSDPISGRYNTHHAVALAMVAVDVLKMNLPAVDEMKIQELDNMLTNVPSFFDDVTARVLDKVNYIIDKLNLVDNAQKFIEKQNIDAMADESYNGDMMGNPYEFKKSEIIEILRKHSND